MRSHLESSGTKGLARFTRYSCSEALVKAV